MKIGIIGHKGKLGSELLKWGCEPIDVDIRYPDTVIRVLSEVNPDVIINCAAITSVEDCEKDHKLAFEVNSTSVMNILDNTLCPVILLSTDHVFSGKRSKNCLYKEHDKPNPLNRYGMTKQVMEEVCPTWRITDGKTVVIRTSKLFSNDDIFKIGGGEYTNVLERTFMHISHFAKALLHFINYNLKDYNERILHISGTEVCTHYQFIIEAQKVNKTLHGLEISPRNYELKDEIPRPILGGLDTSKAKELGIPLYSYRDGLLNWQLQYFNKMERIK